MFSAVYRTYVDQICQHFLACSVPLILALGCCSSVVEGAGLQVQDCPKCHDHQSRVVAANGGGHGSEVGCLDCHPQHPPKGERSISPCDDCHTGAAHFEIGDCLECHTDPHQPLDSLRESRKPAKKECLSCHPEVAKQMAASSSKHADLFCNRCHSRHRQSPGCLDCHDGHSAHQSGADCLRCHPAHQPMKIIPVGFIPREACRPCHQQEADDLADTDTNHGGLTCVYCHQGPHPSTPACRKCHGLPHGQDMHSRHRDCLECHGDAHRLISRH